MQFRFHLFRHAGDGLSLLCQSLSRSLAQEGTNQGLFWGLGASFLGCSRPRQSASLSEWVGSAGRCSGKLWRSMTVPVPAGPPKGRRKSGSLTVKLPLLMSYPEEKDLDLAETLDRLRCWEADGGQAPEFLHVALWQNDAIRHLPPLTGQDRVTLYWELGDVLTESHYDQLRTLLQHLQETQTPQLAWEPYSRWPEHSLERARAVCQSLRLPPTTNIETCKEATWAIS